MSTTAQLTTTATATTVVRNGNAAADVETTLPPPTTSTSTTTTNNSTPSSENNIVIIQDMIDLSANHLEGLRTQCATSSTLTQQEIRSLESKLVRYFSELLLTKTRLNERIPANGLLPHATGNELKQWLRIVGLSQESLDACAAKLTTLEQMLDQEDDELKRLLCNNSNYRDEEIRRLTKAMHNLRKCMESIENGATNGTDSEQWFWDSWDRQNHVQRGSVGNIGITTASPRAHHRQHGSGKPKSGNQTSANHSAPLNNAIAGHRNDRQSPTTTLSDSQTTHTEINSMQGSQLALTLTPSPPNSPFTPSSGGGGLHSLNSTPQRNKPAAGTPPPAKKHQTLLTQNATPTHACAAVLQQQPLNSIPVSVEQFNLQASSSDTFNTPRTRLPTDPSPDSHSSASSDIVVESTTASNVLIVPCSPGVGHVSMGHDIKHRFNKQIGFRATCNLCQKQVFTRWLKCIDCKYLCHKECVPHVPPSCGLPREYVDEFRHIKEQVGYSTLPHTHGSHLAGKGSPLVKKNTLGKPMQQHGDSSSPSSSCTSSTPSSPALFHHQQPQHQHANSYGGSSAGGSSSSANILLTPTTHQHRHQQSQFNFPNVTITTSSANSTTSQYASGGTQTLISNDSTGGADKLNNSSISQTCINSTGLYNNGNGKNANSSSSNSIVNAKSAGAQSNHINSLIGTNSSQISTNSAASNATVSSGYTASLVNTATSTFYPRKLSNAGVDKRTTFTSEYTDTHKSNDSDKTVSLSGSASTDSDRTPVRLDSTEDGDSGQWRQNSISLKEWDIPYDDLHLRECIGEGRFGTVYRALWHGDVAVKVLNEDYLQDEHMLETFKNEVANFKKTRHENLVLFMGACMNPPYLAIVTALCKGNTLYTYIHQRREKFAMNRTLLIAQQIAQGMGYLHARGIIHKDLRTKNIFIENGKVIITDFGLFSSTKLFYCDIGLGIPHNWLCYLAPELIRALMPRKPTGECLEFTPYSDVYSFGTVWYELICGEFTFKDQPAESIIWQVGRGMKQSLANLQSGRDVKDLLMLCWTYEKEHRPEFARLLSLLEHLPKKRLARSPSHPVNLSRSAESVF